jgi:hypothetical protein
MGDDQLDTIRRMVEKAEHDLLTSETMVDLCAGRCARFSHTHTRLEEPGYGF